MGVSNRALERALPIVAAAYGEQFGVRVVLSGTNAMTDGQTIVLPMLADGKGMSEVLFGYLAHESGHIRDTGFPVMNLCQNDTEASLLNLIEDIRIERVMEEAFPGTRETLDAMATYIVDQGMVKPAESSQNESSQLFNYLYHRLFLGELQRESSRALLELSQPVVEETFPKGFLTRLDVLLSTRVPKMDSTQDALVLARLILKALKEAEEEENQSKGDESGDQGESGSDDQSQGGGSSDSSAGDDADADSDDHNDGNQPGSYGQGDSSEQGDTQGDDAANGSDASGKSKPSGQPGDTSDASGSSSGDGDSDADTGVGDSAGGSTPIHTRMMSETDLPEDAVEQLRGSLVERAQDQRAPEGNFELDASSIGKLQDQNGDVETLHAGVLASSAIRSRLAGLLAAQSRRSDSLHQHGRKVDGKRLTRLAAGDSRVFLRREEIRRPDTAVHVLLDRSGSMSQIQHIANQATVSLALAVSSIPQCDIAVSVFPGVGGAVSPVITRGQGIRPNLGRCAIRSTGGTPLGEAMLCAARELASTRKERKVLIVITDGEPNQPGSVMYVNRMIEPFVDVYAIGINSTAVQTYFKQHAVIHSVGELQQALFNIAGRFLDLK
jgi:cobalamin biosynthesis protein CobT